eukprot:Lithocolla_globosa_v1_NODE_161_length_5591_cov_403.883192.p1 type:complete len:675 gc:universal NODE_161_length_5591_cov_403.883192:1994-4018(+)
MLVMISYNHASGKILAEKMEKDFRERNFQVWIDFNMLTGAENMDQTMASGVETCDYFVFIATPQYQASANCRKECMYAYGRHQRRKGTPRIIMCKTDPLFIPEGWLGFLVEGQYYFLFEEKNGRFEGYQNNFNGMFNYIVRSTGQVQANFEIPPPALPPKVTKTSSCPTKTSDLASSVSEKDFVAIFRPGSSDSAIPIKRINVIIVGPSGHGKSTFANFLVSDPKEARLSPFEEGDDDESCTQKCESAKYHFKYHDQLMELNIIDTPGVNDTNPKHELSNMIDVCKHLSDLGSVTCAILCAQMDVRADTHFEETMKYYRKLLQPLFNERNVILLGTKVKDKTFAAWSKTEDDKTETKFEKKQNELKKRVSEIVECELSSCFLINSFIPDKKLDAAYETSMNGGPPSVYSHSLDVRQHILTKLLQMEAVNFEDKFFPLPPTLEKARKEKLDCLTGLKNAIGSILSAEDSPNAPDVNRRLTVEEKIQVLERELTSLKQKIHQLNNPEAKTMGQWRGGGGIFGGQKEEVIENCPVDQFKPKTMKWNCSFVEQESKIPNQAKFLVKPDFIHVFKKEREAKSSHRWFFDLCLVYDASILNKEKVKELEVKKNKFQDFMAMLKQDKQKMIQQQEAGTTEAKNHHKTIGDYQSMCDRLNKQLFSLYEIEMLAGLLETEFRR